MKYLPLAYDSFLFTTALFILCFGQAPVFGDPDTAWHLAAGDAIRALHSIPVYDTWSFTATEERWYNISWLFDVVFSALFSWGGFPSLYALTLLVFALSLTFMAHQCARNGANLLILIPISLLALLVFYIGVLARPNIISLLFTVAFYSRLHRFRLSGRWQDVVPLPLMMALWVNMHGGFLFAFLLMGVFLYEAWYKHDQKRRLLYLTLIAMCLFATLCNPYGFGVYYGAFRSLTGSFDNAFLFEWKPVEIGRHLPMTAWLILMLWVGDVRDKRIALPDRILAILLLLLSLMSVRHSVINVLLMLPYVSLRATYALQESSFQERIATMQNNLKRDMAEPAARLQACVMAIFAAGAVMTTYPCVMIMFLPFIGLRFSAGLWDSRLGRYLRGLPRVPRERMKLRALLTDATFCLLLLIAYPVIKDFKEPSGFPVKNFPVKEAAFVEDHYPGKRFFNDYNIGGYLDFLWRGRMKVFIDGRASSLYSAELLDDYAEFFNSRATGARADMIARFYKLDGIIVLNANKYAADFFWNPAWKVAFRGNVATVYVKKDPEKR